MRRALGSAVAVALLLAGDARATDRPLPATTLQIRDSARDGYGKVRWRSVVRELGIADDPRCNGDPAGTVKARLRVWSPTTGADTGAIALPCDGWTRSPSGYRFRRRQQSVRIDRRGVFAAYRLDRTFGLHERAKQGAVHALLVVGSARYCSVFTGRTRREGQARRFASPGRAAAPDACTAPGLPPEMTAFAADWPLANRDYAGTRATTDSPITAANVATLAPAWRFEIPGAGLTGLFATNPLVAGDTVYVQDLLSNVYAIDRATGAERWRVPVGYLSVGPNGVAIGYGRLYAAVERNVVAAFELASGAEVWRAAVPATATEGIDIQPVVHDGRVFVSTVPVSVFGQFTGGDRGVLYALDAKRGTIAWAFDTVDSPDLWGNPTVNSGGGAWFPPAIDPFAGLTYWGTGNPAPFPGIAGFPNASSRPGPNLYTNSALAVDAAAGSLRWYQQVQPRDLFDHDFHLTMLADVPMDGGARRVLIGTGKAGYVHAFDATDGTPLWKTAVGAHENDDLAAVPLEPVFVKPGLLGGVMTPPAYAGGMIYVAVNDMATPYEGDREDHFTFFPYLDAARGDLVALDAASGVVQWSQPLPAAAFGAATVVNDVVLTTAFDGTLHAFERTTGAPLWNVDLGEGINGWPAVAGDLLVVPVGLGDPAAIVAYRLP